MLPLEGLRIVDMTRVLAGPYCTMILADFGAEVIKIEATGKGDDARALGPFKNGESAYFMSINRNKKSMTLDLKNPEGKKILRDLLEKADAVVENFRPGTMEKLGFGYDEIVSYNPEIVYIACSGFGHTGPYSRRAAYDAIVQAMGGIMSITGKSPGDFTRVGASIGDLTAGLYSALGGMLALYDKARTGRGQKVDVSMLDCQVAMLENAIARYEVSGVAPQPIGNRHPSTTPFSDFGCADGVKVFVAVGNNKLWADFCKVLGCGELIEDPRFATNPLRTQNVAELTEILGKIFLTKPAKWWYESLNGAGVPITYINTIDMVVENEQVRARGMILSAEHPKAGKTCQVDTPIKMSRTKGGFRTVSPLLGADTKEVLHSLLGKTDTEIEKLQQCGAI